MACASLLQNRPVILLVSQEDTLCPASHSDALTEQSARGSLVRGTDSLALDYVASGLNRSVLDSRPWALRQQKEVNRKG